MAEFGQQMEVVNITKIRDGFFTGDGATASNLEVILTFKITHIINTAPTQVMNTYENIGVKYLAINWSENINQNLFDVKDEIANKIVSFINESQTVGEGLLINSLKGQNRACVCVIIYLMKKYCWTLAKSLEFLNSKKQDVDVMKSFLTQLSNFENRLSKTNNIKSSEWLAENLTDQEYEEIIMKNTYLNGLGNKNGDQTLTNQKGKDFNFTTKKLKWVDNNMNKKDVLTYTNYSKDLIFIKDVKPITIHKKLKPQKSCFKDRSLSQEMKNKQQQILKQLKSDMSSEEILNRPNSTSQNQRLRAFSQDPKSTTNNNPEMNKQQPANIQIITPVVSKVVNNNFNNYFITPGNVFSQYYNEGNDKVLQNMDPIIPNNIKPMININNYENQGNNQGKNERPNSVKIKENVTNSNNTNFTSYKSTNQQNQQNPNIIRNDKNPNLKNSIQDNKQIGLIDYSNGNNFIKSSQINSTGYPNRPFIPNPKSGQNFLQNDIKKSTSTPMINHGGSTNLLSKSSNIKQGPIKIQEDKNDYYNNMSTIKKNVYQNNVTPKQYTGNNPNNQMINPIKIMPKPKENIYERPSTAPSKNDIKTGVANTMNANPISNSNSLKRLPSPNVKSSNLISDTNKNPLYSSAKYRSPSPANLITNHKTANFGLSSFKGLPSKKLK